MEYKGKFKDLVIPTLNVNDTKVTIGDIRKEEVQFEWFDLGQAEELLALWDEKEAAK